MAQFSKWEKFIDGKLSFIQQIFSGKELVEYPDKEGGDGGGRNGDQYVGPEYPNVDEYEKVSKVLKHIKKNVIFADAMDQLGAMPAKVMTCAEISGKLSINLSQGFVGYPDYFSADISQSLMDYMTKEFIDPLMSVQHFIKDILVRDEVQLIFRELLSFWKGKNTDYTLAKIIDTTAKADYAGRNRFFLWYIQDITPLVREQAIRESKLKDGGLYGSSGNFKADHMSPMPISVFMREFFLKYGFLNHTHKELIKYEHLLYYLNFWKDHRGKLGLLERGGQKIYPDVPGEGEIKSKNMISFDQVVDKLLYKLEPIDGSQKEADLEMKERWAQLAYDTFLEHLQYASPYGWRNRFMPEAIRAHFEGKCFKRAWSWIFGA